MITNPDGSITLTAADARGVDALIKSMDQRARSVRSYTAEEAAAFARNWAAAREQALGARNPG